MNQKTCNICNICKDISEFWKKKDRLVVFCKDCGKKKNKEIYEKNKEKIQKQQKENYTKNREKRLESMKSDYIKNRETRIEQAKTYRENVKKNVEENGLSLPDIKEKNCNKCNQTKSISSFSVRKTKNSYASACKDCRKKESKMYRKDPQNKETIRLYKRTYKLPVGSRVLKILRNRLNYCVKNIDGSKTNATKRLLGCSPELLKKWIEFNLDIDGYILEDYGSVWNSDHVLPCNVFDLEKEEDISKCFHWTNIRPLCKIKNSSKQEYIYWPDLFVHEIRLNKFIKLNRLNEDILSVWKDGVLATAALGKPKVQQQV